jgi:hypothetical protein
MRTHAVVLGLLAVSAGLLPEDAVACGDKFLVIGRGVRRVQKARHHASIALYLPVGSALRAKAKDMRLETTLKQAGHTVESLSDAAKLRERVASRPLDFVIADLADAPTLEQSVVGHAGRLQIVPVAQTDASPAAEAGYPLVIRAGKSVSYLSALDALMAGRPSRP